MKKKETNPPLNPGISLLLVVFLVLCLLTFAAITVTTALNEKKRSDKLATNNTAYYEACNLAEREIQNQVNNIIKNGGFTIASPMEFTYDIDEVQVLHVALEPLSAPAEDRYFTITRWQVVNNEDWKAKDTLNLITLP